jgi:uncharacterized protein
MAVSEKSHYLSNSKTEDYVAFPVEGILEGEPNVRVHWLRDSGSGEGMMLAALQRADPSRLEYVFPGDETFLLLKGEIDIELTETGETVTVRAGDIASFPKGAKSIWNIKSMMEKFVVVCADPS